MKIFLHWLVIAPVLFLQAAGMGLVSAAAGTDGQAVQPEVSRSYDWYTIGELFAASRSFDYNRTFAEHLDDVYGSFRDFLVRVQVSKETVAAFSNWLARLKRLPWTQPFHSWSYQDQIAWQASAEQAQFTDALEKEASKTPEARFFFLLGGRTEELVWTVPSAAARRLTVVVNGSIKRAGRDFQLLTSDPQLKPLFGKLSPGVQEAIKLVCDVSVAEFRDEDPKQLNAEPLSAEEIERIVAAADVIRRGAKMSALFEVPGTMIFGQRRFTTQPSPPATPGA